MENRRTVYDVNVVGRKFEVICSVLMNGDNGWRKCLSVWKPHDFTTARSMKITTF